jgi:hypothetical protein
MTDMRADEPDAAGVGPPGGLDAQWASRELRKKRGSELGDATAAVTTPTAENADVGAARRQRCGPVRVHRKRLRGRGSCHRLPRGYASGLLGRFNLAAPTRASGAQLLSRLLQFRAKLGDGLLLLLQHPEQLCVGWNVFGMGDTRRHQARDCDQAFTHRHFIPRHGRQNAGQYYGAPWEGGKAPRPLNTAFQARSPQISDPMWVLGDTRARQGAAQTAAVQAL